MCQHAGDKDSDEHDKYEPSDELLYPMDSRLTSRLMDQLRPPLWLIHGMMGHPCVRMREAVSSSPNASNIFLVLFF